VNHTTQQNQIFWDEINIEKAIGIKPKLSIQATAVSIDTRTIKAGEIFVAIKGENFNGNNFANDAIAKGAALCILDEMQDGISDENRVLLVDDAVKALEKMALYIRGKSHAKFIGVTGSVGKTSVKEMLRIMLNNFGVTYASKGNFNNYYGLPLVLANMPIDTDFAIYEMGMSSKGEISYLSNIVRPDVSIITTVEAVHLEHFNSVEDIAYAKAEIFDGMSSSGFAVLNADNKFFDLLKTQASKKKISIISYGKNSDIYTENADVKDGVMLINASCFGQSISYKINAIALQHVMNSAGVIGVAHALGLDVRKAADSLSEFTLPAGRGKIIRNEYIIADETYNASPSSVISALKNLNVMCNGSAKSGVVVLGDMKELGVAAKEMHESLVTYIDESKIRAVVCIGNDMKNLYNKLSDNLQKHWFVSSDEAAESINKIINKGDVVLIKGSRSMQTEKVLEKLL